MTVDRDTETIRSALGRIGDGALPAPDFDELHLRAIDARPTAGRAPWSRRLLPVAAALAVVVSVLAVGLAMIGDDGEGIIADRGGTTDTTSEGDGDDDGAPGTDDEADPVPEGDGDLEPEGEEGDDGADDAATPVAGSDGGPDPALSEIAAAIGAEVIVVASPSQKVWTWTLAGGAEFGGIQGHWSDGRFVYGISTDTGEHVAAELDGTVVCRGERRIQHVTERDDGTFVMAAEDPEPIGPDGTLPDEPVDLPLYAVDCGTGNEQPIEPVHRIGLGDGETSTTHRIADRVFLALGDAEGNVFELRDEAGRNVIGEDYLGLTVFGPDGALLAYGDQRSGASPHVTKTVGVRDLEAVERLWTATLDGFVVGLWFVDDRLVVGTVADDPVLNGASGPDELVVFEVRTGERLADAAAPAGLIFVG